MEQLVTVKSRIAGYGGRVEVVCNEDDDDKNIIAKAKKVLTRRKASLLPIINEHYEVVERRRTCTHCGSHVFSNRYYQVNRCEDRCEVCLDEEEE